MAHCTMFYGKKIEKQNILDGTLPIWTTEFTKFHHFCNYNTLVRGMVGHLPS